MRRLSALLLTLTLVLGFVAPVRAQLLPFFGPPTVTATGIVNYIQPTHFTVMGSESQLVRIFIPEGKRLPSEVQIGVEVVVVATVTDDNLYMLDHFEEIRLTPAR